MVNEFRQLALFFERAKTDSKLSKLFYKVVSDKESGTWKFFNDSSKPFGSADGELSEKVKRSVSGSDINELKRATNLAFFIQQKTIDWMKVGEEESTTSFEGRASELANLYHGLVHSLAAVGEIPGSALIEPTIPASSS
jgi:hypothetical protein